MTPKSKSNKPSLTIPHPPLGTPALHDPDLNYSYEIARGEIGEVLWAIFESYVEREDFVGADMTRKYIQMGMTRAKRYANHKGGKKYGRDGKQLAKWTEEEDVDGKRREKEEASELFKGYWRRCTSCERYVELKKRWQDEKKEFVKSGSKSEG
ncbi:hypothetical protein LTS08_002955 [Lithohypha guttulata]|nr:hypothetical protein LTS08_002955 [Lithohypha guttulata]